MPKNPNAGLSLNQLRQSLLDSELGTFSEMVETLESKVDVFPTRLAPMPNWPMRMRINHAASGICDEAGEIIGPTKKHLYYNAPLDRGNMVEELGDLIHYAQMLCNILGINLLDVIAMNQQKLAIRYPNWYNDHDAQHRDKPAEKAVFKKYAGLIT